jgi:hypothetical protein
MVVIIHKDACRHGQEEQVHLHSVRDIDGRWILPLPRGCTELYHDCVKPDA